METSSIAGGTLRITLANASQYIIMTLFYMRARGEILTAAAIYVFALYILKALRKQDFELLKHALPQPLTKYLIILERIIVR